MSVGRDCRQVPEIPCAMLRDAPSICMSERSERSEHASLSASLGRLWAVDATASKYAAPRQNSRWSRIVQLKVSLCLTDLWHFLRGYTQPAKMILQLHWRSVLISGHAKRREHPRSAKQEALIEVATGPPSFALCDGISYDKSQQNCCGGRCWKTGLIACSERLAVGHGWFADCQGALYSLQSEGCCGNRTVYAFAKQGGACRCDWGGFL